MCMVSVIYDTFNKLPDDWYTLDRIDLFKDMVHSAELFDKQTGQPDCADSEKEKIKERIADLEAYLSEYRGADCD